jgi:3-oxoacyl-[acyl-carrier protein] reductase
MDLGLEGRTVLVTGASSGIGAALAAAYGGEGASVAITYRTDRDAAEATARAVEAEGGRATTLPFDLGAPNSARTVVHDVVARFGRIDVLVANAVHWPERSPAGGFEELPPSAWTEGLRINIEGTFALVQAAVSPMRAAGWGRILLMSTGLAEEGMRGAETYIAAKSALHGLARSLAWDVGRAGILVNVLAAGLTLTERNRKALPQGVVDGVAARVPLGRLSTPAEVVAPALFLTSAANTSITGEVIREGSSTGRSGHSF